MIPSLHPHKHTGILAMGQFYNRTVIIQFLIFILGRRLKFNLSNLLIINILRVTTSEYIIF